MLCFIKRVLLFKSRSAKISVRQITQRCKQYRLRTYALEVHLQPYGKGYKDLRIPFKDMQAKLIFAIKNRNKESSGNAFKR